MVPVGFAGWLETTRVEIEIQITSVCLGADCFAFGELLDKAPPSVSKSSQGLVLLVGPSFVGVPSLRRRSVGPRRTDIHVLAALSPHPCGSAHCASPAFSLHPSRVLRCLDLLRMKIKGIAKIKSFPAEAGPTDGTRCF